MAFQTIFFDFFFDFHGLNETGFLVIFKHCDSLLYSIFAGRSWTSRESESICSWSFSCVDRVALLCGVNVDL